MQLLNIPKRHYHYYVLVLVLAVFIVLPVQIPHEMASLVDTTIGKAVIIVLVINLLMLHPVLGSISAVAAYELIRRSSGTKYYKYVSNPYLPSERKRARKLKSYNQFPLTVEELVIRDKIPYTFNLTTAGDRAPYKPVQHNLYDASVV